MVEYNAIEIEIDDYIDVIFPTFLNKQVNFQTSGHFSRNIKYFGRFISLKAAVHMDINSHFFGRVNVP